MSFTEDNKQFMAALIRSDKATTLSDAHRAVFAGSSMKVVPLRKDPEIQFRSNIEIQQKAIWLCGDDYDWDQLGGMLTAADIDHPTNYDEHLVAIKQLATHLRRWGKGNLKGQFGVYVLEGFIPKLRVLFENDRDRVKFKLAWVGL